MKLLLIMAGVGIFGFFGYTGYRGIKLRLMIDKEITNIINIIEEKAKNKNDK